MSLNNIKNMQKDRGFTIVELLIVIVVIGILAAITIVAYNGIQNRSKTTSAQSLATNVAKKAEAYNAIANGYPATRAAFATQPESTLDDPASVTGATPTNERTVLYQTCATPSGFRVTYFTAPSGTAQIHGGDATTASTCTTPAS